jgi:hypothetical protein
LPRESAKTELIVSEEGKSFPLLASWSVDKGRVVSFTSDANGRWSAPWIPWRSINEFWSDLVESTLATSGKARSNVNFDLRSWVEGGEVVVDLSVFDDIGNASVGGSLTMPSAEVSALSFTSVSPGHYQARAPKAAPGRYLASLSIGDASLPEIAWEVSDETFTERPHFKPNTPLLQQLASRSGGILNPEEGALKQYLEMTTTKRDLARVFASLALLLFVLEILFREFGRLRRRVKSSL